jgi:4-amino-4-deoxy-L-arabinose transferase-like glycosyltransferase
MATAMQQAATRGEGAGTRRVSAWTPYVIGLVFALSALRGVRHTGVVNPDASRHAMNGVFIYDMVRTGHLMHPIAYAKEYYAHFPVLSMPYHPPLFPAIESLFFAVFGVNLLAARLAVALAVGVSAVLLYRLIQVTLGSQALAACVTVTMLSLWSAQWSARDVLLEFPVLAFTLAALYCLRDIDRTYPLDRAMWFAAFATAAVWTKQQAVFLGAVPVIWAVLNRRWRLLLGRSIWISSLAFGAAVVVLISLSAPFNYAGVNKVSSPAAMHWILARTVPQYAQMIVAEFKGLPVVFACCAIASYAWAVYKRGWQKLGLSLYFAWILSLSMLLFFLNAVDVRYLFLLYPAVIAVMYVLLFRGCAYLWGEARAWYVPAALTAVWLVVGLLSPIIFLRGPGEVAALVAQRTPARILYIGRTFAPFSFALRSLDPRMDVVVIPAGKVPASTFEPKALEEFCRRFAINWIVVEQAHGMYPAKLRWTPFLGNPPAESTELVRSIPLESDQDMQRGNLYLYRFTAPAAHPDGGLALPVPKIGGDIEVMP